MPLDDIEPSMLEQELDLYLQRCEAVDAAVIATADGRLRAQRHRATFDGERTAVMGSS